MIHILIKHTVEDYDTWKPIFDEHASTRMEYGSQGYRLFHVSEDPNELVLLFEYDSAENVQKLLEESDLREVMEKAGMVGEPEIYFLNEIESKSPEQLAA